MLIFASTNLDTNPAAGGYEIASAANDADPSDEFCALRADCYEGGVCDPLKARIRQIIASNEQCRAVPQSAADFLAQALASRQAGIDLNYYGACRRAVQSELDDESSLCAAPPASHTKGGPHINPGDPTTWGDIFKWVGIGIGSLAAGLYVLAKALKYFNKAARAAMNAGEGFFHGVEYLFEHPVASAVKAFNYVRSGDWLPGRKEERARRTLRNTQTMLAPGMQKVDPIIEPPQLNVVLTQLQSLEKDKRFEKQAAFFANLDPLTQFYLAQVAINKWYEFAAKSRWAARREIKRDKTRLPGALPTGHIEDFAINHLTPQKRNEILAHASNWEREIKETFVDRIRPDPTYVENQFASAFIRSGVDEDLMIEILRKIQSPSTNESERRKLTKRLNDIERRMTRNNDLVKFYSMKAINDWPLLTRNQKIALIDVLFIKKDGIIQDIAPPNDGELPLRFIRATRQGVDAAKIAPIFVHLLEIRPELENYGFEIAYLRAEKLLHAFEWLPRELQTALGGRDWRGRLSDLVMDLTSPSFNVGTTERLRLIPAANPWKYDSAHEEITSEHINVSRIKYLLVKENEKLAMYPEILDRKARTIAENWLSLSQNIKDAFFAQDRKNGAANSMGIGISVTYIKFWLKINSGIGTGERPAIDPRGSGSGSSGSGSAEPSGGAPNLRHSQIMPIPSSAMPAEAEQITYYDEGYAITAAHEPIVAADNLEDGVLQMVGEELYGYDQDDTAWTAFEPVMSFEAQFAGAFL